MMRMPLALCGFLFGSCLGIAAERPTNDGPAAVSIELKSAARVRKLVVSMADVADLHGGNANIRERIANLDLGDAPTDSQAITISARQIEFRLLLADFPKQSFRMAGAREVKVSPVREKITEDTVLSVAKESLLRTLPYPESDLSVKLVQPIVLSMPKVADWETPIIRAELHSPRMGMGRSQLDVTISVNGETKLAFPVYFETVLLQMVPVARCAIRKGELLTAQNIFADRRPMDPGLRTLVSYESVLGKKALQPIATGQVIGKLNLDSEGTSEGAVVIRPRQAVKMVVRLGPVNIVTTGEAMQEGRLGQTIRVQNLDSKKVVSGRVTGPGAVDVETGGNP